MCNIYVILKTTGEYEDTFTTAECACLSNSEALEVKKKLDEKYQNCSINQEEWWNYREKLYDYEEQHDIEFESYSEGFAKLFPELNKEDVEFALRKFKNQVARNGNLSKAKERAEGYKKPGVRLKEERRFLKK